MGITTGQPDRHAGAIAEPTAGRAALRILSSPLFIASVAFGLRLAALYVYWHRASPAAFTGPFGYEEGCVAKSISSGQGFSSPLPVLQTGPTAYLCPVYPYILAAIFKIWGIYAFRSHVAAQVLNSLFVSLTVFPIYGISKRTFGATTAIASSWLWVILPTAWHIPIYYVWETSLSALWFALLIWATFAMVEKRKLLTWAAYGLLWALGTLINASVLEVMPFCFLWLVWDDLKHPQRWLKPMLAAALLFILGIAPWTVRNYLTFHRFIPMRSNLGLMLWVGNNPGKIGVESFPMTPGLDRAEAERFRQMGEIKYMQMERREAIVFIHTHPKQAARNVADRIAAFWFSVTDRPSHRLMADPLYLKGLFLFNLVFILLSSAGLTVAWRERSPFASLYAGILIFFPLVYYLTCALVRYRFPIDSVLAMLAAFGASRLLFRGSPLPPEGNV